MKPKVEHLAEGIELWLGDCRDVLPTLGKVDALVTDPPYGVGFEGKTTKNKIRRDGYKAIIDDDDQFIETVVIPAVRLALLKADRAAIFCGCRQLWKYPEAVDIGNFFQRAGGGCSRWGFAVNNPILYYGKDPYLANGKGSIPSSWLAALDREPLEIDHPCPKPLNWMLKVVERVTIKKGDTVLDPFCGSGTTGAACVQLERRFIGIELHKPYFDIACKRIDAELRKPGFLIQKPKRIKPKGFFNKTKKVHV